MTTIAKFPRSVVTWLRDTTPRWITLLLALFLAGSAFTTQNAAEVTRQEQRVESRCALRGAFFYLADLADSQAIAAGRPPSQVVVNFRAYLDDKYPALVPQEECPK